MKQTLSMIASLVLVTSLAGCNRSVEVDLVVVGASILEIESGDYIRDHLLVVHEGEIQAIAPASSLAGYRPQTLIDGEGKFIVPALGDVHVHLQGEAELKSYLRYGVTSVVNMSGRPTHLKMKAGTESGEVLGPTIYSTSPTLDGAIPTNPLFISVTPESASAVVRWVAAQGYDAIKVYQQLDGATLEAIVERASAEGLITTGHVSRVAGLEGTLESGMTFIAHGEELSFPFFVEDEGTYRIEAIPDLARSLKLAGATVTPMINYLENISPQVTDLEGYLSVDEFGLVPAAMRQSWDERQSYYAGRSEPEQFVDQIEHLVDFVRRLTLALHSEGVFLVLGTDAGFGGAIPGHSVHEELRSLVRAGLSPLQALQTATLNIGAFLNSAGFSEAPWGRVAAGYRADFMMLPGDPLTDISVVGGLEGVSIGGTWIDQQALDVLEREARSEQDALLPLAAAAERLIVEGNALRFRQLVEAHLLSGSNDILIAPDNCIFLGYRHFYGGERELAGNLYATCALMSPDHGPLQMHIGRAREAAGDVDGALAAYEEAHVLNPWYGNPQESIRNLTTGVSRVP